MAYFTTKQTPSFAPVSMGGPLDFLTQIFSGGAQSGGDPSVSGENPEWWNRLSDAQKNYFAKNGAQLAPITYLSIGCPRVGPDGTLWKRNSSGWCGPEQKKEPGVLDNALSAVTSLFGFGKKADPAPQQTPASAIVVKAPKGMSTGTKIAIGVGAVGAVAAIVVLTKKKQ